MKPHDLVRTLRETQPSDARSPVIDGASFVLDASSDVPAVWGDGDLVLWSSGEPLLLVGPIGVGKSTLAQQLVLRRCGVDADDLLGFAVAVDRRPVLYLALDRPIQIQRSLRRMVAEDDRRLLTERLLIHRGPLAFAVTKRPEALARYASDLGAGTLVIDSLKDVGGDLSEPRIGAAVNQALQACIADGVEVVALHHMRKRQTDRVPTAIDDVLGSVWIAAGAGSVLLLWGEPGADKVELRHLKQPLACIGPLTLRHDHERGATSVAYTPADEALELDALIARYLAGGKVATSEEIARAIGRRRLDVDIRLSVSARFVRAPTPPERSPKGHFWMRARELVRIDRTSRDESGQVGGDELVRDRPIRTGGTSQPPTRPTSSDEYFVAADDPEEIERLAALSREAQRASRESANAQSSKPKP
jgi:AAA domain-containing protein